MAQKHSNSTQCEYQRKKKKEKREERILEKQFPKFYEKHELRLTHPKNPTHSK